MVKNVLHEVSVINQPEEIPGELPVVGHRPNINNLMHTHSMQKL